MRYIIRRSALISFTFLALFLVGCGRSGNTGRNPGATNKPLAMPPVTFNRPKIVAFGDSLTAGFGLLEKESYPYLLQEKLKADGFDYVS